MNKTLDYHLPDPPRKPVRLGVVGLGFIFHNCHGPALRFLRQHGWPVELVAVAVTGKEPRQSQAPQGEEAQGQENAGQEGPGDPELEVAVDQLWSATVLGAHGFFLHRQYSA